MAGLRQHRVAFKADSVLAHVARHRTYRAGRRLVADGAGHLLRLVALGSSARLRHGEAPIGLLERESDRQLLGAAYLSCNLLPKTAKTMQLVTK